ncbi:hypothetical protein [uncultured Sphingomonas sp.]|nr:hypothetical protein [uncultured Sphingomonas sp.]
MKMVLAFLVAGAAVSGVAAYAAVAKTHAGPALARPAKPAR